MGSSNGKMLTLGLPTSAVHRDPGQTDGCDSPIAVCPAADVRRPSVVQTLSGCL